MQFSVSVQDLLLAALIAAAFYTDVRTMRIPNALTAGGTLAGLAYHTAIAGYSGLIYSGKGLIAGFGMLFVLYLVGALGAGDVKLFAAIGAAAGLPYVVQCLLYSVLYSGMIGAVLIALRKRWMQRAFPFFCDFIASLWLKDYRRLLDADKRASLRFPFMYAVLPAAITAWFQSIS
jgi:prepilin peptidase CpaA